MLEDGEEETVNYREEILRLVAEGKIKRTTKYVETASDETLEKFIKITTQGSWTRSTNRLPPPSSNNSPIS